MDYENLKDNATYEAPTELAGGIDAVFVNGVLNKVADSIGRK